MANGDPYDLAELARSNWHVHTSWSPCARGEMTLPAIVAAAEAAGLRRVALTDHYHRIEQDLAGRLDELAAEAAEIDSPVELVIGAELSATGPGRFVDSPELNARVGYRLYACNHYHLDFWQHPADRTGRGYAEHMLAVLAGLIPTGRADCIAHPFSVGYLRTCLDDPAAGPAAITDAELLDVLELARAHQVAWELNTSAAEDDIAMIRRLWDLGREVGVAFRVGTDAHEPARIDPGPAIREIAAMLA